MKIIAYLRHNPDLTAAGIFALATTILLPWEPLKIFAGINFSLLLLLFCLMAIVAGLRESGLFVSLYQRIFHGEISSRSLGRFFIFSCFFSSMLITNDVALIIFVPLAITILTETRCIRLLIPVVTWQTIAANMGSTLTPIGNPQNLFIYSHYQLNLATFLQYTCPVVIISGIVIYLATLGLQNKTVVLPPKENQQLPKKKICWLLLLFTLCLLNVLHFLPSWLLGLLVIPALGLTRPQLFRQVDYKLLFLFSFLFVGVGNLTRIPEISIFAAKILNGHEFFVSLLLSQFISNVPATVMLSPYTTAAQPLLLGVNIGGLGTIIASMASVISFKAYVGTRHSKTKQYLLSFTAANLGLLFLLLLCKWLLPL